jgi:subtilase family serine protease
MDELQEKNKSDTQSQNELKFHPSVIQLAELIKSGYLDNREREIEEMKIEVKDRLYISIAIVIAIVFIVITIAILTFYNRFEVSTLAFMLGASIGSLLTILGKHLTGD